MAGAGLLVYALESSRIERSVTSQINQEIAEFRRLRRDPNTGRPFDDVERVLEVFLTRNVPDDDEMLVGYVDGARTQRTANRYGQDFLDEAAYLRALEARADDGGTTVIESEAFGEVWLTLVPVRNAQGQGALVIVNFLADEHEELNSTMRTYSVVAFLSLLPDHRHRGRAVGPTPRAASHAGGDRARHLDHRPVPAHPRARQRRHHLAHPHHQLDVRATGRGIPGPAPVPRRRRPRAAHSADRARGHLELLDEDDPLERAETQELLLDEVDRMSRLVGDLILLAKSRRPDFLVLDEVDLDSLTQTVLAKARGLGERHWTLDDVATGTAVLDEQRVTQALLQLADNAVKHTDPGAEIAIGSEPHRRRRTPVGAGHRRRHRPGRPGHRPRAVRPQSRALRATRASVSACRSSTPSSRPTGAPSTILDAEPRGARVELIIPIGSTKETSWPRS